MRRSRANADAPRPTLRCVAKRAGVTPATVSMALRGHPAIPPATRARVQHIADQLGYKPDPQVGRLMQHLRLMREARFKSTIAAITDIAAEQETPYARAVRVGAQAAAAALGYTFDLFRFRAGEKRDTHLQRMLHSRGIDGILLLPVTQAQPLGNLLDWNCFSIVAATHGILAPDFHRVVPDQFGNMLLLGKRLLADGCRRIGLVIDARTDLVVDHRFSAALMWLNTLGGGEQVRPLVHDGDWRLRIRAWFARQRPDAIIVGAAADAAALAHELADALPRAVRFAATDVTESTLFGGVDQRPERIGAAAVNQLNAQIQCGEKGVPEVASVVMVKGHWVEPSATTLRTKTSARTPAARAT